MRVASVGHAALYIETDDQRILIDPVFAETLAGGALRYHPARRLDLEGLPTPTAVVVTHGHFDHFHPPSLARLRKDLPLIAPEDPHLLEGLRGLGFSNIIHCEPWRAVTLGQTRIVATPSAHEEPEFGVVVSEGGRTFWHMADAEVTPADGARVLREYGPIDVVSVKYQPVVRASMGHLRTRGARFDKEEVIGWLEAACAVHPAFVFPYAAGLCFTGRHAWFNRYAFPFSAEQIVDLLRRRLGATRADVLDPGDVVILEARKAPERVAQACSFVATDVSPHLAWEPVDTSTLTGFDHASERADLEARLDRFLEERLTPWLADELRRTGSPWQWHRDDQVVWQLVVESGASAGERIERHVDYASEPFAVRPGRHPRANSFTHVSGRTLLEVLRGEAPGLLFWLAGAARSYESVIGVVNGRLFARPAAPPEDELGDPVTYFLRHFGPTGEGSPMPLVRPMTSAEGPTGLEVLARQGESRAVVEKKVLLSLLAAREAARLGVAIEDVDVQATSDEFRVRFGLLEAPEMHAWLEQAGLDLASYTAVMRGFTAVTRVQARVATEIEALIDAYTKVASARRLDR